MNLLPTAAAGAPRRPPSDFGVRPFFVDEERVSTLLLYSCAQPRWDQTRDSISGHGARIWNVASGQLMRTLSWIQKPAMGGGAALRILFSRDGRRILCGAGDAIHFWDIKTGRHLRSLTRRVAQGRYGELHAIGLTANERWLVSGGHNVMLWRLE